MEELSQLYSDSGVERSLTTTDREEENNHTEQERRVVPVTSP